MEKILLIEHNILDLKIEYSALEKHSKFIPFEEKCRQLNINTSIITNEEIYELKNKIYLQINNAQKLLKPKKNEIINLNKQYINEKKILQEKIERLKILRKEFSENKKTIIIRYHNLLEKGRDPEGKGLSNIIEKIWKLNSEIILSYLPKFLDCNSIDFLFTYTKLKIEKDKALNNFKTFINQIYENNNNNQNKVNKNILNEIIQNFDNKFKEIENWKKITCDKVEKYLKFESNDFFNDVSNNLSTIKNLRNSVDKIIGLMNLLKKKEIERIKKEFLEFDYERRFDTSIKEVFVALFGDEKAENEIKKFETEQKFPLIRHKIIK